MKRDYLLGEPAEWTEAELETAVPMWKGGETASRIAEKLPGRSRNAVLGKMNRMGLLRYDVKPEKREPVQTRRYSRRPPKVNRAPRQPEPEYTGNRTFPVVRGLPEALLQRSDRQCGYPLGEPKSPAFRYCSAEREGDHIYCTRHRSTTSGGLPVLRRKPIGEGE